MFVFENVREYYLRLMVSILKIFRIIIKGLDIKLKPNY